MYKKIFVLLICIFTSCTSAFALDDGMRFDKSYAQQVQKERATIANALILSTEQTARKNEIAVKYSKLFDEKFQALSDANLQLKLLKAQNAACEALNNQEKQINTLKKEIKNLIEQENKEFKKILDRDQRAKLRMIQKLQRKAIKECAKKKDYYKKNPKMRPFAPQI